MDLFFSAGRTVSTSILPHHLSFLKSNTFNQPTTFRWKSSEDC